MSTVNPLTRQVSAKIVYVGPGLSGKTTSLHYIHSRLNPDVRGELVSLATNEDRTLFFDFLPLRVPRVNGLEVRLQLYTVPGQVFYAAMRKLVLNGADGVVFVADAQTARREANVESLGGAEQHLRDAGVDLSKFPMVFQYNKMDLDGVMEEVELRETLNPRGLPQFRSVATHGAGVLEALRAVVRDVVRSLRTNPRVRRDQRAFPAASPDSGIAKQLSLLAQQSAGLPHFPSSENLPRHGFGKPPVEELDEEQLADSIVPAGRAGGMTNSEGSGPFVFGERASSVDEAERDITTERPIAGVSFGELWEPSQRAPIALIESCISGERYHDAVHHVANALAHQLGQLPVPADTSMAARAALLGVDGREYLRLCRLASQPNETIVSADALFALYLLVGARIKFTSR